MTYPNDPPRDPRMDPVHEPRMSPGVDRRAAWSPGSIVLASLAAVAVVLGLFYAIANRDDTATATRTGNRPAVTTTAPATNPPAARETTGSGATTTRTPDSTASKPAVPGQVPAPASPNR
jgi:hypothetical protein